MKLQPLILGVSALPSLALAQSHAAAQAGRLASKYGDDAVRLAPILLGLFTNLTGLVAILGAGLYARDKPTDSSTRGARMVAAAGGVWSAYHWFGWPFVTHSTKGFLGFGASVVTELSFLRLLGLGGFALLGVILCTQIAGSGGKNQP